MGLTPYYYIARGCYIQYVIPYLFQSFQFEMQRENQWSNDRGYLQHLDVLKRISARKPHLNTRKFTQEQPVDHQNPSVLRGKQASPTFRDQQILWENYLLGKRIIQTPPVISKRKLEEEYQKHRRLVGCLTSSSSRRLMPCDFRVKKLQEYKENIEQHQDERLKTATSRNQLRIDITNLAFYRQRPALDNLELVFSYHSKSGKVVRHSSEGFPAEELLERHFYFSISGRLINKEEALTVELRNLKGLAVLSVGHFSFPSSKTLQTYTAQLFHCGRAIGQVELSTNYARKTAPFRTSETDAPE